jgi:4-amino-4-deoxy-L-arabinose transferase-like glycosyltransferase
VFFVILPLSLVTALLFKRSAPKYFLLNLIGTVAGLFIILALWFSFGDGLNFLLNHYSAISSRVESRNWATFLVPAKNILTTYWPWLPFLFWSLGKSFKNPKELNLGQSIALMMSLIVLVGFSLAGHFFEHYLTSFYPPAALLVSVSLYPILKPRFKTVEKLLWGLTVFITIVLAVFPIQLRKNRAEPLATTLREMSAVCQGQKEILITQNAMDRWLAVAITLWKTPYEIKSITSVDTIPKAGQLLITSKDETPSQENWEKVPLCLSQFNLYQSKQFHYCR